MSVQHLLIELFVEELPPKSLKKLGEAFATLLADSLKSQGLAAADAAVTIFATPRRLAVRVSEVVARAPDRPVSHKLMPVSVGLDAAGNATPALIKRLSALGVAASVVPQLRRAADGKNEALFYDSIAPGTLLVNGVQTALETAMAKLPIPKLMSYQLADGWSSVSFVRPLHGLVALHGADVVPVSALGLSAGRATQGHRFEASVNPVVIRDANSYAEQLRNEGAVIASFAERRVEIIRQFDALTAQHGLKPIEDDALLDEVTALVERPNVLLGKFDKAFLDVPQECLILTMKANQKYFPLLDAAGKLTNQFLVVSNICPADPSAVIGGNERVIRPRLADARFFFEQDKKKTLDSRVLGLARVVYHNKLGSQGARVERVQAIARAIAQKIDSELYGHMLSALADKAALLAKADLLTDMVGEFPELQGIMGRYYAQHDGLNDDIAFAIEDHYKPRFSGDELPRNDVGVCVALADKLETLVGLFGIGQVPTGDKDPFALRRHALGVIRLLTEKNLQLSLDTLLQNAANEFKGIAGFDSGRALVELEDFIDDRLAGNLREQGYSAQEVDAVLALHPQTLAEVPKLLDAVHTFAGLAEAPALAAANKRVGNILKKSEGEAGGAVDPKIFVEMAESALFVALGEIAPKADAAFVSGDYTASLQALAALKAPVDAFFDSVMVNADDPALKANRLALLKQLHQTMNRVADISRLAA
ncbi:MAG: glycine--tRNA ligase subunit beta [Pseudomonadota bacterium]